MFITAMSKRLALIGDTPPGKCIRTKIPKRVTKKDDEFIEVIKADGDGTSVVMAKKFGILTSAAGHRLRKLVKLGVLDVQQGKNARAICVYTMAEG